MLFETAMPRVRISFGRCVSAIKALMNTTRKTPLIPEYIVAAREKANAAWDDLEVAHERMESQPWSDYADIAPWLEAKELAIKAQENFQGELDKWKTATGQ
jgi:hypothetical protein